MLLALLFGACAESDKSDPNDTGASDDSAAGDSGDPASDSGDDSAADTGEPADDGLAMDITAEISEAVHTVVIVTWRTEATSAGYVEFGKDASYGHQVRSGVEATEHRVVLLGMTADTEVHFRVVVEGVDGDTPSGDHTITTLSLPSGIPQYVTSGSVGGRWTYNLLPTQGSTAFVNIIDENGDVIWYYEPVGEGNLMKAILTHDRQHMLLGHAGNQGELETSKLTWVSLDGLTVVEESVPYFDHDLTELADGTVAMIMVEERTMDDGRPWNADRIVERAPDGTLTEVFNAWEQLDPDGLGLEGASNWTHGNGLEFVASEDAYYLSMKEIGSIAKIPRSTGTVEWLLNGKLNQFAFLDGAEPGTMQHQFEVLDTGHLLIFDNGSPERGYSRAVEVQLDTDAMTAEQLWEYVRVPPVYVYAKGDVQRFDDGSTQVTWSTSGEIQIVDEAGAVQWQLNADLGLAMTFIQPFDSFYEDR